MPAFQITAHVVPRIHKRFGEYASKMGVDDSSLTKLLILRERELRRLPSEIQAAVLPGLSQRKSGRAPRADASVTAHMSSAADVRRFDAHARNSGLSRSKAAAWLIEKELSERWFEKALRLE